LYQNHRRYVKSREYKQLLGWDGTSEWNPLTLTDIRSSCDPIIYNRDLENMGIKNYFWRENDGFEYAEETPLVPDQIATPCGLIAKSMFNDTFAIYTDQEL
jgi:hypothetical protein